MIASFERPDSERHLYFKLNNSFHLCSPPCSSGYKIAGLYSIHSNGLCRYVGQSQNLPSRLANHLSGHYSYADEFRVYFICDDGFEDFYERNSETRKIILENNELKLIQRLKPLDNIVSDFDKEIPDKLLFNHLSEGYGFYPSITGLLSKHEVTIFNECAFLSIDNIDQRALTEFFKHSRRMGGKTYVV